MNFLAHSLFGFGNSGLIAGQFCGDFVRGSDLSQFDPDVELGIRLHRHLDRFTDTHAVLLPVRQNIPGVAQRFAGIVVDVMFDHYLAQRWNQISDIPIEAHAEQVHAALKHHEEALPENLKRFMALMQREGILQGNVRLSSIELTLHRIAKRSTKLSSIALKEEQLEPLRDALIVPFNHFLPDLNVAAAAYMKQAILTNRKPQSGNEHRQGSKE